MLSTGLLKVVKVTRALSGGGSLALSRDRRFSLLTGGMLFIIPRASGHTTAAAQVPGFQPGTPTVVQRASAAHHREIKLCRPNLDTFESEKRGTDQTLGSTSMKKAIWTGGTGFPGYYRKCFRSQAAGAPGWLSR